MADEQKNITFTGYVSLNNEFTKLAKDAWGCTKEEAICAAMLMFLEYDVDTQNLLCSEFRAAASRQIRTEEPIQDVFRRALLRLPAGKGGSERASKLFDAIRQVMTEQKARRAEGQ